MKPLAWICYSTSRTKQQVLRPAQSRRATLRNKKTTLLLAFLTLVIAACGTVAEPVYREAQTAVAEVVAEEEAVAQAVALDEALYQRGIEVYLANYCGSCHALEAAGTWGSFGPAHDEAATLAAERLADPNYAGSATTIEEYLHESIVNPQQYFVPTYASSPHRMPAYTHLPEEDIQAMVYLLAQQG